MSAGGKESPVAPWIFRGFLAAWVWRGKAEAALETLRLALRESCSNGKAAEDWETEFWRVLHREASKAPAAQLPDPEIASFHEEAEPGRSLGLLCGVVGMEPERAWDILKSPPEPVDEEKVNSFRALGGLVLPAQISEALRQMAREFQVPGRDADAQPKRNPAAVAVVAGIALLAGVAFWHLTGRMGQFPDEVVQIATVAAKASAADFAPVEAPVKDIPDWFALQGLDWVKVPRGLGELEAVGVRTFRHEGETVAQVAALSGEQRVYLLSFAAEPFGLALPKSGSWIMKQAGRFALAATREGNTCLVISIPGTQSDLLRLLNQEKNNAPSESPEP